MIYSANELLKQYGSYASISRKEKRGLITKIGHGLYSDNSDYCGDLEHVFLMYKNITLTSESAFYFHDLTDYIPQKYQIASENKGSKIAVDYVEQSYMNKNLIKLGRKKTKTRDGYIYIFDKERMLVELVRLRSKFSYDFFKEVINNYRKLFKEDKLDMNRVLKYCEAFKRGKNIRKEIEDMVI